jgi:hypothetical protein
MSISPAEVDWTAVVIGLAEARVRKVNMPTMDRRSMLVRPMVTRLTLIQVKRCIWRSRSEENDQLPTLSEWKRLLARRSVSTRKKVIASKRVVARRISVVLTLVEGMEEGGFCGSWKKRRRRRGKNSKPTLLNIASDLCFSRIHQVNSIDFWLNNVIAKRAMF